MYTKFVLFLLANTQHLYILGQRECMQHTLNCFCFIIMSVLSTIAYRIPNHLHRTNQVCRNLVIDSRIISTINPLVIPPLEYGSGQPTCWDNFLIVSRVWICNDLLQSHNNISEHTLIYFHICK